MTETQRRIRAARAYSGMTLDELAERVGIGRMTLYRMENGQRDVKRMELREIAEACDLPAEFFTGDWTDLGNDAGRLDAIEDKLDTLLHNWNTYATALTGEEPEDEDDLPDDYDREAFVAALRKVAARVPLVPPRAPDAVLNPGATGRSKSGSQ